MTSSSRGAGALRLSMWSGPRNVSTALMYSFRQRSDTTVIDEPFYGVYLGTTGAAHPAARDVMAQMECDGQRVLDEMLWGECPTPVLFIKNMAHHLVGLESEGMGLGHMDGLVHALLVRDPVEMLPSLAKVLVRPTLSDTGLVQQCQILEHEMAAGREPVVIDARELLSDPERVLAMACLRLGLRFEPAMLAWPPGPKPEDGPWAPHWYSNVHRSTGFSAYRPPSSEFPGDLEELLDECLPYYQRLTGLALRARSASNA